LDRYRKLSLWNKLAVWGSIASLAGLAIAMGSLAWIKERPARTTGSETLSGSPDPSAPIRETSAREVLAHLQSLPPLQRQRVESTAYLGRHVRWRGRVQNLRETASGFLLVLSEEDDRTPLTVVQFGAPWRAKLEGLRKGDIVLFEGVIAAFDAGSISVDGSTLSSPKTR